MTPPQRPDSRAQGLPLEAPNAGKSQNQVELGARWMGLPRRVPACLKGGGALLRGPPLGPEGRTLPGALSRPASPLSLLHHLWPPLHHLCRTPFPQAVLSGSWCAAGRVGVLPVPRYGGGEAAGDPVWPGPAVPAAAARGRRRGSFTCCWGHVQMPGTAELPLQGSGRSG